MKFETIELSLFHKNRERAVSAEDIGEILIATQKMMHALSLDKTYEGKSIPNEIKNQSLIFFDSYKKESASIAISSMSDLVGYSKEETLFYQFVNMIANIKRIEYSFELFKSFNFVLKKNILYFLEVLVKRELSLLVKVSGTYGIEANNISFREIDHAYRKLSDSCIFDGETLEFDGQLVGINKKSDFFAFISNDNIPYSGRLSKAMKNNRFEIPSFVTVKINEQKRITNFTGEEKRSFTLENIKGN